MACVVLRLGVGIKWAGLRVEIFLHRKELLLHDAQITLCRSKQVEFTFLVRKYARDLIGSYFELFIDLELLGQEDSVLGVDQISELELGHFNLLKRVFVDFFGSSLQISDSHIFFFVFRLAVKEVIEFLET